MAWRAGLLLSLILFSLSGAQAEEWSCSADCWAATEACESLSDCATRYAECMAYKAATCALQAIEPDRLIHGNYCGLGDADGRDPIDALDLACEAHDLCYEVRGREDCFCDRVFVGQVIDLTLAGDLPANAIETAGLIAAYYGVRIQSCPQR